VPIYDLSGNRIQTAIAGQPIVIPKNFTNSQGEEREITFLFEVRDEAGITVFLAWQTATVEPMNTKTASVSWATDIPGVYQARMFVISNLTNPQVLEDAISTAPVTILGGPGNSLYKMEVDGIGYDIEYSLEGGYIRNIVYDIDFSTILIQLHVSKDSHLKVEFPYEVAKQIICELLPIPGGSGVSIEVFVDTMPAEVRESDTGDSIIWQVQLQAGTEEVELVGCGSFP
jgi:hypothetical protein